MRSLRGEIVGCLVGEEKGGYLSGSLRIFAFSALKGSFQRRERRDSQRIAEKKGGLLKTFSRETALFEEPTYLGYRNAIRRE